MSKDELLVALRRGQQTLPLKSFPNTPPGQRDLARYLARKGRVVRVCMESTGWTWRCCCINARACKCWSPIRAPSVILPKP